MWPSDWVLNDKEVLLVILLDWRPGYMFQRQTSESQRSQTGSRDEKPFILSCYTIPSPMFAFVTPLIFWISTDTSCDPIWASMPDLQPATANQRQSRNDAPPSPLSPRPITRHPPDDWHVVKFPKQQRTISFSKFENDKNSLHSFLFVASCIGRFFSPRHSFYMHKVEF